MPDKAPIQLSAVEIDWLRALPMSRRAAVVRDHILEYGFITTGTLKDLGYDHPPRAAMDLKDAGAGVVTTMVRGPDGRRMGSYAFSGKANQNRAGRIVIPKPFSDELKAATGYHCAICSGVFEGRELQSDHRIPFAIAGDQPEMVLEDFMPLCASDNRAKSWSCEQCPNFAVRDPHTCETCFWAHPEDYKHVATRPERRLNLIFQGDEVTIIDHLRRVATSRRQSVTDVAKAKLRS